MARESALTSVAAPQRPTSAELEIDEHCLYLTRSDGRWSRVSLVGSWLRVRDASFALRFVRHAALRVGSGDRVDLITPPEEGAIAPRAARLPGVPTDAAIVGGGVWDTVVQWIRTGGGLAGRTIAELAQLAAVATPQFAITLGECAAQAAVEMTWDKLGPMRGGGDLHTLLRPFELAARSSARANEAFIAAMSLAVVLR